MALQRGLVMQKGGMSAVDLSESNQAVAGIPLVSECGVDYAPLQEALGRGDFQQADTLTRQLLCQAASYPTGTGAATRGWLYFTDVDRIAAADLQTVDRLWRVASGDRFGFSVQRRIWVSQSKRWERLWPVIGWKQGNHWTRFPDEFVWDLSAPKGHLPLSNQLRGVQVMAALLTHQAWEVEPP